MTSSSTARVISEACSFLTNTGEQTGVFGRVTRWYAVYVRSRHEKLVAKEFKSREIVHWLPLVERRRKWSDRWMTIAEPLFPGYVFVNISLDDRVDVLEVRGVVRLVGSDGRPTPVPAEEIEAVRIALITNLKVDPYPYLRVGKPVEVLRGPLRGLRGTLINKNRKHRLLLSIPLIGQSAAVDINAVDVRAF